MQPVPVERLAELVVAPGMDKHLVPLLAFRGNLSLGRVHRYWNFAISMMEHGCTKLIRGNDLHHNRDFAQLCGPEKYTVAGMNSFMSRLLLAPTVANNIPGLLDYCKETVHWAFSLTPVPFTRPERSRGAWWRTWEGKRRAAPGSQANSSPIYYPFLIHEPTRPDEGYDLTKIVNDAVPKGLPQTVRADICQDLIVAVLSGDVSKDNLMGAVKPHIRKVFKMFPAKYADISLDAVLRDGDDRTLHDVIAGDAFEF